MTRKLITTLLCLVLLWRFRWRRWPIPGIRSP